MKKNLDVVILIFLFGICFAPLAECEPVESIYVVSNGEEYADDFYTFSDVLKVNEKYEIPKDFIDFLSESDSVYIARRGNILGDAVIRGGNFESTSVEINGIPLKDPQTGHFLLSLPLIAEDIDFIRIRKYSFSHLSENALSGTIDINLKDIVEDKCWIYSGVGENKLSDYKLRFQKNLGKTGFSFSFAHSESEGYDYDTDYNKNLSNFRYMFGNENLKIDFFAGGFRKEFGASNFYSDMFPNQYEEIGNFMSFLKIDVGEKDKVEVKTGLYGRRISDRFLLNRERPDFYENINKNYVKGFYIKLGKLFGNNLIECGLNAIGEKIDSSNLGLHKRNLLYFSAVSELYLYDFNISPFFKKLNGREIENDFGGGIKILHKVKDFYARLTLEKSFRIPSFTELYYQSPANKGDEDLRNENSKSVDFSLYGRIKLNCIFSLSFYRKKNSNYIDWVRKEKKTRYVCENLGSFISKGAEAKIKLKCSLFMIERIEASFNYNKNDFADNFDRKYIYNYPEYSFNTAFFLENKDFGINSKLTAKYVDRKNEENYFLANFYMKKVLNINPKMNIYVSVQNILNESYTEFLYVKMPGRWVETGMSIEF